MKGFRNKGPGFSLLELILALGLVTLVVLFSTNSLITVIQVNSFSQNRTAALALAQEKMEELKARSILEIAGEREINLTNGNIGTFFRRETSISPSGLEQALVISVQVTWPRREGGGEHRVALSSQIAL